MECGILVPQSKEETIETERLLVFERIKLISLNLLSNENGERGSGVREERGKRII